MLALSAIAAATLGQCIATPPGTLTTADKQLIRETLAQETRVGLGTSIVVTLPEEIQSFTVSNREIIQAKTVGKRQLLVVAVTGGRGDLRIVAPGGATRTMRFTALSTGIDDCTNPGYLRGLTPRSDHFARLETVTDQPAYVGEIDLVAEYDRLRDRLETAWPGIRFLVRPSAHAVAERMAQLNADLEERHLDGIHATWADGGIVLETSSGNRFEGSPDDLGKEPRRQREAASRLLSAARADLR
jgi:hypothetical protein